MSIASNIAKALQEEINRRLPAVDLTDILVEVDNWVGFTQHLPGLEHAAPDARAFAARSI